MCENYLKLYEERRGTVDDCLALINSSDVIWCSNNYNEPTTILSNLHKIADKVENVFLNKSRIGNYPFMHMEGMDGHINFGNYFYGPNYGRAHELHNCTFYPVDLPNYYRCVSARNPWHVFIAQVSPMDENGQFFIGMNQTFERDLVRDALEGHKKIILEVNPNLTWMRGAVSIPVQAVTKLIEVNTPEETTPPIIQTAQDKRIGEFAAEIVSDGDTIQMGIGGITNAIGDFLMEKKELGLHTEQFTSSMVKLIEAGVVTGSRKTFDVGEHVGVFADGTPELYRFLHNNSACVLKPGIEVVNPAVIARHDHITSINTCIEIDLTGQVCAESIGSRQFSGSGGGFCFTLGAYYAEHGKSIIAFPSRTKKGVPKICSQLTPGAVVTHQRNYIDYIVTEYGVVNLKGASVRDRAKMLISVAHPEDREKLTYDAKKLNYF